jgi:hypothetical protein
VRRPGLVLKPFLFLVLGQLEQGVEPSGPEVDVGSRVSLLGEALRNRIDPKILLFDVWDFTP